MRVGIACRARRSCVHARRRARGSATTCADDHRERPAPTTRRAGGRAPGAAPAPRGFSRRSMPRTGGAPARRPSSAALELHARRPRRRRASRPRARSVSTRWSRPTSSVVVAVGGERAQRIVEPAHAPAADGEDLVAGRQPGRSPAPPRSTCFTLTPVSALSLTRTPSRWASVARLRLELDAEALPAAGAAAARRCRAPTRASSRAYERPPTASQRGGDVGLVDRAAGAASATARASRRRASRSPSPRSARSSASATSEPLV